MHKTICSCTLSFLTLKWAFLNCRNYHQFVYCSKYNQHYSLCGLDFSALVLTVPSLLLYFSSLLFCSLAFFSRSILPFFCSAFLYFTLSVAEAFCLSILLREKETKWHLNAPLMHDYCHIFTRKSQWKENYSNWKVDKFSPFWTLCIACKNKIHLLKQLLWEMISLIMQWKSCWTCAC